MKWRVIPMVRDNASRPDGVNIAHWNMAVDEAIHYSVHLGLAPPTIRFYEWPGSAVSIGYSSPSSRVHVDNCDQSGITYVRRWTGGRPLGHHAKDLTYSVVAPSHFFDPSFEQDHAKALLEDGKRYGGKPAFSVETYQRICAWQIEAFKKIGLEAKLTGKNSITLNGLKISGNAQRIDRSGITILQHGSIFYASNGAFWNDFIDFQVPLTTLQTKFRSLQELSPGITRNDVYGALLSAFTENPLVSKDGFEFAELQAHEIQRAQSLIDSRYAHSFEGNGTPKGDGACALDVHQELYY